MIGGWPANDPKRSQTGASSAWDSSSRLVHASTCTHSSPSRRLSTIRSVRPPRPARPLNGTEAIVAPRRSSSRPGRLARDQLVATWSQPSLVRARGLATRWGAARLAGECLACRASPCAPLARRGACSATLSFAATTRASASLARRGTLGTTVRARVRDHSWRLLSSKVRRLAGERIDPRTSWAATRTPLHTDARRLKEHRVDLAVRRRSAESDHRAGRPARMSSSTNSVRAAVCTSPALRRSCAPSRRRSMSTDGHRVRSCGCMI